jgi:hypothetical protein
MAISMTTSVERRRAWLPPREPVRPPSFIPAFTFVRRAAKPRGQSAEKACEDDEQKRESNDSPVEADVVDKRQRFWKEVSAEGDGDRREPDPDCSAGKAEDQAFKDRLPQQCACWSAESQPHSSLLLTADGADEQESGEVSTGDQQHDNNSQEQHPQKRTGFEHGDLLQRIHHGLDAEVRYVGRIGAHDLLRRPIRILLCLGWRHAGLEPAHKVKTPVAESLGRKLLRREACGNP